MINQTNQAYAPRWVKSSEAPAWTPDEIVPGLFMGGTADNDTVDVARGLHQGAATNDFDAVATLYAWARPADWGTEELRYGFMDGGLDLTTIRSVVSTAIWVHERWKAGSKVLVRCQAGLNRSGLVTALVLMLEGHTALEAIELLRTRRSPWVLCNNDFVQWLIEEAGPKLNGGGE